MARLKARERFASYGGASGVLAFRQGLPDEERSVIESALSILERHLTKPGKDVSSSCAAHEYLCLELAGETREVFAVLYLDAQHRAIAFEVAALGTLKETTVYPREVVRAALRHGAAGVIFAHNHPSGHPEPSPHDEKLTAALSAALRLIDVVVLDHIVVAGLQTVSMAEREMM
jgi:DNA repair protein RadC